MKTLLAEGQLLELIAKQINHNFMLSPEEHQQLDEVLPDVLASVERCFAANVNKYYRDDTGEILFNPFHSGQYSVFLYFLAHLHWRRHGRNLLADKLYYLNKVLNAWDLYYEVEMPQIFFLDHPVGTVIGRAEFSNYFIFQQGCTVGGNHGNYPRFGEFVWMFANTIVIGNSKIGENVFISAGSYIKDEDIPDNSIVFGRSPHLSIKQKPPRYFYEKSPFFAHRDKLKNTTP